MALIWRTHPESSESGTCKICEPLNGKREGDGWSRDGPTATLNGPPPLHRNCQCTIEEETTQEWAESIEDDQ